VFEVCKIVVKNGVFAIEVVNCYWFC